MLGIFGSYHHGRMLFPDIVACDHAVAHCDYNKIQLLIQAHNYKFDKYFQVCICLLQNIFLFIHLTGLINSYGEVTKILI